MITVDIGPVSAYAIAKANGFTGTYEEWAQLQADCGINAQAAAASADKAEGFATEAAASANEAKAAASEAAAEASQNFLNSIPEDYSTLNDKIQTSATGIQASASGSLTSIADGGDRRAVQAASTITAVQSGTGDPSPDNVRPISGWDEVTLTRAGKNLLGFDDFEVVAGAYTDSCAQGVFTRTVTTQHTTTFCLHGDVMANIANAHIKAGTYVFTLMYLGSGKTFTAPYAEVTLIDGTIVQLKSGETTTIAMDGTITGIKQTITQYSEGDVITYTMQLEAGEVATDYEPYQGQTLTASLPETVYGGSLDWTTGVLTVTHHVKTLTGNEAWSYYSSDAGVYMLNYAVPSTVQTDNQRAYHICSHYKPVKYASPSLQTDMTIYTLNASTLCVKDTTHKESDSPLDNFKSYLSAQAAAGTPVTLVWPYKPASYRTIQLTPQQLDMLKGRNTVWSDSGDTSLVYIADTKMYIDNAIAAIAASIINA